MHVKIPCGRLCLPGETTKEKCDLVFNSRAQFNHDNMHWRGKSAQGRTQPDHCLQQRHFCSVSISSEFKFKLESE